jgi:hypothetical protein
VQWEIRKPSLRKRIAVRTSVRPYVRHSLGLKAPAGSVGSPIPARSVQPDYNRTTIKAVNHIVLAVVGILAFIAWTIRGVIEVARQHLNRPRAQATQQRGTCIPSRATQGRRSPQRQVQGTRIRLQRGSATEPCKFAELPFQSESRRRYFQRRR